MKRNNRRFAEIGCNFKKELEEIKLLRKLDIDAKFPKPLGDARLTDGLLQYPEWKILKDKLRWAPREEALR